jgi:hypothetical protein
MRVPRTLHVRAAAHTPAHVGMRARTHGILGIRIN